MEKTITIEIPEEQAQQVQSEIPQLMQQINESLQRTKAHQARSAKIGEHTRQTLSEIDKLLGRR